MDKRHLQMVLGLLLASGVSACGGGGTSLPATTSMVGASVPAMTTRGGRQTLSTATATTTATATYVAIDAGSSAASGAWEADTGYASTGVTGTQRVSTAINTTQVTNPAPQAVYQTQRFGTGLTYTVANLAPAGTYSVRLHFVESFYHAAGMRVFSGTINGVKAFTNLDIFATAGGANRAIVEQFSATADASGKIAVALSASVNNASIAGLEVTAVASPVMRIDSGGGAASGGWISDTDYTTGGWGGVANVTAAIDTSKIASAAPQAVYQTQRWASTVTYTIPNLTPNGAYTVQLDFVESYWTAAAKRLFDVTINGVSKLSNFDIFATAGGQNIAIAKDFAVTASASGTLTVQLVSSVDYASIAGVEIMTGSSTSGPTPAPSPTPVPAPSPTAAPVSGSLPGTFDQVFSSTSPLRTKLSNMAYTTVQAPLATSIWNKQVLNSKTAVVTGIPVYVSSNSSDPLITVGRCTLYGGGCSVAGKKVHINRNDVVQGCQAQNQAPGGFCDGHILLIDPSENIEVDCWGARDLGGQQNSTPPFTVDLSNNQLICAWGGWYPLNSTGLNGAYSNENSANDGSGIAFGPAAGLFMITPNELLAGHIDHALALNAVCMDAPSVYPSDFGTTDTTCDGGTSHPHYGDAIMYIGQTDAQIAASSRSIPCKGVLTALHDYGGYFSDTGDNVTRLDVQSPTPYDVDSGEMGTDIYAAVYKELATGGDGDSSGNWEGCFNGLSPSNFNLIELTPP